MMYENNLLGSQIKIIYSPSKSIAYNGRVAARESKFKHHKATPAPRPCKITNGVERKSLFNCIVHILSAGPTTGPIST